MNILTICGFGLLAVILCVTVRQIKPGAAIFVSIGAGVMILAAAISAISPSVATFKTLAEQAGLDGGLTSALIKALAVCYITTLCADCARDAGESALGSKLELAGRVAIAAITLPVFTNLAGIVTSLLN